MAASPFIPTIDARVTASVNVENLATRLPEIGSLKPPSDQGNLPWIQWNDILTESDSSADQLRAWMVYLVYLREAIHWDANDHQEMRQYLAVRRLYQLKGLNRLAPSRTQQYCVANAKEENFTLSIGHLLKTLFPKHPVIEFWALHRRVYPGVPAGVSRTKESAEVTGGAANPIELGFDGLDTETSLASRSQDIGIDSYLNEIPTHLMSEQTASCGSYPTPISMNSYQHVEDSNPLTCGMTWRVGEAERKIDITTLDVTMTGPNHIPGGSPPLQQQKQHKVIALPVGTGSRTKAILKHPLVEFLLFQTASLKWEVRELQANDETADGGVVKLRRESDGSSVRRCEHGSIISKVRAALAYI
ncbi:unnamed protein product [Clonostachys byssicola]|uniref:Uncharacterized protein n=1 Tax=Clonostachys byssicola TaxID=160290 RepID=A0A9N9Y8R5_9HYPO|nr:unnamed protein product [Clonostachys byssicola]